MSDYIKDKIVNLSPPAGYNLLENIAIEDIFRQREEILTAFIAKYGIDPEECEQVIEQGSNKTSWFVRKR